MGLSEYEDFVYGACLPDLDDPVGCWKVFAAWQQKIVDFLAGKETVHVNGPDVDLRLRIAGRPFLNCDDRNNMPDGGVFTGPVEDSSSIHWDMVCGLKHGGDVRVDDELVHRDGVFLIDF